MGNSPSAPPQPAPAPAPIPFPSPNTAMPDACVRYSDENFAGKRCVNDPETFGVCIDGADYDGLCQACTGETVWTRSSTFRGLGKCEPPAPPAPAPAPPRTRPESERPKNPEPNTPMPTACIRYGDEFFKNKGYRCGGDPNPVCIDGVEYETLCIACTTKTDWKESEIFPGYIACDGTTFRDRLTPKQRDAYLPLRGTTMPKACRNYSDELFKNRGYECYVDPERKYRVCIDGVEYDSLCFACTGKSDWEESSIYTGLACDGTGPRDRETPPAPRPRRPRPTGPTRPESERPSFPKPNTPMPTACIRYGDEFFKNKGIRCGGNPNPVCIDGVEYETFCIACTTKTDWKESEIFPGVIACDGTTSWDRLTPVERDSLTPRPNTPMPRACNSFRDENFVDRGLKCNDGPDRGKYPICVDGVDYESICVACTENDWEESNVYNSGTCPGSTPFNRYAANVVNGEIVDFVTVVGNGGDVTAVSIAALACAFVPTML